MLCNITLWVVSCALRADALILAILIGFVQTERLSWHTYALYKVMLPYLSCLAVSAFGTIVLLFLHFNVINVFVG
jgi:hypothetical protein